MKIKKIFIIITILIIGVFAINQLIEKRAYLYIEDLLSSSQRNFIKKYLVPYKYIDNQDRTISYYYNMDLKFKKSNKDILVAKMKDEYLSNNKTIKRYNLINGFYLGMKYNFPGSGFIDFDGDNLLVLSSRGVLGYTKDLDKELNFKQIKNNINEYINLQQFLKNNSFSLKDLLISGDNIFVSYSEEIEEDCWNTSVLMAKMNYKDLNLKNYSLQVSVFIHLKTKIELFILALQVGELLLLIEII